VEKTGEKGAKLWVVKEMKNQQRLPNKKRDETKKSEEAKRKTAPKKLRSGRRKQIMFPRRCYSGGLSGKGRHRGERERRKISQT